MSRSELPIVDRFALRERSGKSLYRIQKALEAGRIPAPTKAHGLFWAEADLPEIQAALEKFEQEARRG